MVFRTLLLEDDPSLRNLLELMLTRRGHQVISYDSPLHCPLLDSETNVCDRVLTCIDFLITDNQMPGMTGMELIQLQARQGCLRQGQQRAIMSGTWREQDQELARSLGFQVFRKPFNWNEFSAWLDAGEQQINATRH
jgi:CheY-like chemotaxis protein